MSKIDKLQIRYVNMFEERLIPFSGLITLGNNKEIFFLFRPCNEAYVLKYGEGEKYNWREFRKTGKLLFPLETLLGLKIWLTDIIEAEDGIINEFNGYADLDGISVQYKKIDNESGKIHIEFDDSLPWTMDEDYYSDEPIEGTVSKFDFINAVYGGLVDYIAENFNGEERFDDIKGGSENLYETFFCYDIDKYLKENGVEDIDERVAKAKKKIREEWKKVWDECDKSYKDSHDPYWHTFDYLMG